MVRVGWAVLMKVVFCLLYEPELDTGDKLFIDVTGKYPKSLKFFAGVNNTTEKLFTGVNNTSDKLFSSVNDTGD
jgi:hypothetical protein